MAKPSSPAQQTSPSNTPAVTEANWKVRLFLGIVCFLAGAAVMVIEISANRLLAPVFGNSVYTWTALIGVILVAFSAGGFLGGWLADRRLALDLLGWLLAGAAVLTFFIPSIHGAFAGSLGAQGLVAGPVAMALLLFAVPGVLLGAISPAAVRFYSLTQKDTHVGAAAGTISMLGSLGSFVGTFLSGFYLLSTFGVRHIFTGTAALLMLLAVLAFLLAKNTWKQMMPILLAGGIAGTLSALDHDTLPDDVLHQEESFYHRIRVSEDGTAPFRRRVLELDSTQEGGINPDTAADFLDPKKRAAMPPDASALILDYQHFWRIAQFNDSLKISSALFIGAGAFGMPEEVSREHPEAAIDVAEIDPRVIEIGRRFFFLDEHPKVNAQAVDARRFLLTSAPTKKWDLVFGDAYNGIRQIPAHLASQEFFQLIADHLSEDGVFVMNAITAIEGPRAELLGGMLKTLRAVFPNVEVFAVGGGSMRSQPQNVILVATKSDWRPYFKTGRFSPGSVSYRIASSYVSPQYLPGSEVIFTDDHNPVDAIIARGLALRN